MWSTSAAVLPHTSPHQRLPAAPLPCRLRVALKPVGTGIYPVRILLTSTTGVDTRVVDLELTAQVRRGEGR